MAAEHIVRFLEYADHDDQLIRRLAEKPSSDEIVSIAAAYGFAFTANEWETLEQDMYNYQLSYSDFERLLEKMNL